MSRRPVSVVVSADQLRLLGMLARGMNNAKIATRFGVDEAELILWTRRLYRLIPDRHRMGAAADGHPGCGGPARTGGGPVMSPDRRLALFAAVFVASLLALIVLAHVAGLGWPHHDRPDCTPGSPTAWHPACLPPELPPPTP